MQTVDPRQLQINLTGFLEKNTSLFVKVTLPSTPPPPAHTLPLQTHPLPSFSWLDA